MADPHQAILTYFVDMVNAEELEKQKREKTYNKKHENVINMEAASRYDALSREKRNTLLKEIIEKRQEEAMEEDLTAHMMLIKDQVDSIFIDSGIKPKKEKTPIFNP